ncbi:extracellular elastinolytic metalloproteinase [Tremella mesenterica]|uniref:Extracellular metalloproteinase n=1 Tax=Tremella mesenterica TaxID=5217 RepID=A0A4Q1BSC1_TREME|nr:extracellular elastinolytic metalloproteinase [Tremella mesenterica]
MRSTALVALLPLLATLSTASPHHKHHHHSFGKQRKTLSFGPTHKHATFEVAPETFVVSADFEGEIDATEVAKRWIADKVGGQEGVSFYLRSDSYTDPRTLVTHIYAKQLVNGLEVSDGDINVNVDRDGRVLSWGSSFLPSAHNAELSFGGVSGETARTCSMLKENLEAQKDELHKFKGEEKGPWGIVKSAVQVMLGGQTSEVKHIDEHARKQIKKNMRHIKNHLRALCHDDEEIAIQTISEGFMSPIDALVTLIPRLSTHKEKNEDNFADLSAGDFESHPIHSLTPKPAPTEPPTEIITGKGLAAAGIVDHVPARLMYTQTSDGQPRLVWKLEVQKRDNWYEAYVDVASGELLRIVDWASDLSWDWDELKGKGDKQKPLPPVEKAEPYTYAVFPWGINDPMTGNLTVVSEPWDKVASPLGWHQYPTSSNPWSSHIRGQNVTGNMTTFYTTVGNNVIAHEDWEGQNNFLLNYRPVNESLSFVYDYGEPDGLAPKEYIDMVVTQLFYTSNMYHDLLYRLGFDEISGNFQAYNFGLGGRGGDPVIANAQDGSGYNNANFMTPPDGTPPRMRMYVWDTASPYRDGDLEAGIVIHEYSHGLSTRLTGGPANSGCLGYGEAGGMGEGWGDAIATLIRQVIEHDQFDNGTDTFAMGAWAANRESGIRNYMYASNATTNPSTYKTLDSPGYWGVHAIGEVWAEFLFVMAQHLVEKYGFSKTLFPPNDPTTPNDYYVSPQTYDIQGRPLPLIPKHGNTLALQLIIDAMKIQPCRPSFFHARDAIIQADQIRTGGQNRCLIWKAFAERGLGQDASVIGQTPWGGGVRQDGHKVPHKICKKE